MLKNLQRSTSRIRYDLLARYDWYNGQCFPIEPILYVVISSLPCLHSIGHAMNLLAGIVLTGHQTKSIYYDK